MNNVRVLFTAGREPTYVRNTLALRALRARFAVSTITSDRGGYLQRLSALAPRLALNPPAHDIAFAGFFGQPLVFWLRLWGRQPIVLDAFVSAYDSICLDRCQVRPEAIAGRAIRGLERLACAAAQVVVVDTKAQADFFATTLGVNRSKLRTVYLGYDSHVFAAETAPAPATDGFHVFHYGSYLPLHGVDIVVRAAKLLAPERDIRFTLVGRGLRYGHVRRLAEELAVQNVRFVDWLPYDQLPSAIASAHVCLGGHFGPGAKAARVIAGKTYQFLAMGRPTIVGESAANREILAPGEHAVFCRRGEAQELAEAILALKRSRELRDELGRNGRDLMLDLFQAEKVADDWQSVIHTGLRNE